MIAPSPTREVGTLGRMISTPSRYRGRQVFSKVVLFQVIKRIVPPMSNEIITLIKDTALANCIMIPEIIKQAKELAATKALIWPLFYTGVFYLLFVGLLTILLGQLEKKLSYFKD
jgi:polar amino acid transport system permease protein